MKPTTLILGLGNDLLSDDGFGPAVAEACRPVLVDHHNVVIETASVAGFHLLDLLSPFQRVLIIDVVQTGLHEPGTLQVWSVEQAGNGRTLGGSHQMDLATTLAFAQQAGVPMPNEVRVLVAEAKDLVTIAEKLCEPLANAVPIAVEHVLNWINTGDLVGGGGLDHERLRAVQGQRLDRATLHESG